MYGIFNLAWDKQIGNYRRVAGCGRMRGRENGLSSLGPD
ncbi:uncharacterized protein METZ01_LOCUS232147, partial [marine metagenome]